MCTILQNQPIPRYKEPIDPSSLSYPVCKKSCVLKPRPFSRKKTQKKQEETILILHWIQSASRPHDGGPTDQPPVLLDSPGQSNLLSLLSTSRTSQLELSNISLGRNDLCTRGSRSDIDHENFVLGELGNLGLLSVGRLDSEETTE